jgi:hypothetical protein
VRSILGALAGPEVQHVRRALFVIAAVGATLLDEAKPLIEPPRARVRLERPELKPLGTLTLGYLDKSRPCPVSVGST